MPIFCKDGQNESLPALRHVLYEFPREIIIKKHTEKDYMGSLCRMVGSRTYNFLVLFSRSVVLGFIQRMVPFEE